MVTSVLFPTGFNLERLSHSGSTALDMQYLLFANSFEIIAWCFFVHCFFTKLDWINWILFAMNVQDGNHWRDVMQESQASGRGQLIYNHFKSSHHAMRGESCSIKNWISIKLQSFHFSVFLCFLSLLLIWSVSLFSLVK